MNQIASPQLSYEYLRFDFKASRALVETAMVDSCELRVVIAKVICYSIVIFALIAAFESIVINGMKLALNAGIWMINTSNSLLFPIENQEPLEPPPVPPLPTVLEQTHQTEVEEAQVSDEPMPPLHQALEDEFKNVFKMLAMYNQLQLGWHFAYLTEFRERTKNIHPLQVMSLLLEKHSEQRKHAALFIDKMMVGSKFINDTLDGFENPIHVPNTPKYIPSFAEAVGISVDAIRGFLLQKPPHLKDLVYHILRQQ
jgi:hypothetical protein